jgi:hypothetical protein
MDGRGPSQVTLDPSKGNVYQVQYQYLGYGEILYSIERPGDGRMTPVHRIQYSNANTSPSLLQTSLKLSWFAASLGSSSVLSITGASGAGFVEGDISPLRNPFSYDASSSSVGTNLTNIVAFRTSPILGSATNVESILPRLISAAAEATKPVLCEVLINPTWSTTPSWSYLSSGVSVAEVSTTSATLTIGASTQQILSFSLGKSGQANILMDVLKVAVTRGDIIAIGMKASSGTADCVASMSWLEE